MKLRNPLIYLAAMICTVLILVTAFSTAYATDPGDWYIPWGRYDQWTMSSATLSSCDVTYSLGKKTVTAYSGGPQYTGYWHSMNVSFNYPNGPTYLEIIAPADGTVIYSQSDCLDVETDEGDVYELATSGNYSKMYKLSRGTHISGGKVVGEVYLRESNPTLTIQYLVKHEPTYLFGIQSRYFINGANLVNYQSCTYDTSQTSGSSSKPDLSLENMWKWGGSYDNDGYHPYHTIHFNAEVAIKGDLFPDAYNLNAGSFTIRWIVRDSSGYIDVQQDLICWVNDPVNPELPQFDWKPEWLGTYYITCILDPSNDIKEADECNNSNSSNPWIIYVN